jgi:hypothetical protein
MRKITADLLKSAAATWQARPGSFELFGFDFMMDARLNVWLLEVGGSCDLTRVMDARLNVWLLEVSFYRSFTL